MRFDVPRRRFTVHTTSGQFEGYDAVVIACPLEVCGVDVGTIGHIEQPPKRHYKQVVVTFVEGVLRSGEASLGASVLCCLHIAAFLETVVVASSWASWLLGLGSWAFLGLLGPWALAFECVVPYHSYSHAGPAVH